jgi:hypothetical protein
MAAGPIREIFEIELLRIRLLVFTRSTRFVLL